MHFSGEQSPHVAYLTWLLYLLTNTHTTLIPGVVLRTGQIWTCSVLTARPLPTRKALLCWWCLMPPRHSEVKWPVQGHRDREWQSQDSNPVQPVPLTSPLRCLVSIPSGQFWEERSNPASPTQEAGPFRSANAGIPCSQDLLEGQTPGPECQDNSSTPEPSVCVKLKLFKTSRGQMYTRDV